MEIIKEIMKMAKIIIDSIGLIGLGLVFGIIFKNNILSKKGRVKHLWIAFLIALGMVFFFIDLIAGFVFSWPISVTISLFIIIAIIISTAYNGWTQVPQNEEWVVQLFGEYLETWDGGLNILFPWFGFMNIPVGFFMGQQQIRLYMDETIKKGFGYGHVDFVDGSAPVESSVYFKITDSFKAAYNITNLITALEEKMDGAIRSYLGAYRIDEANVLKAHFSLGHILNGEKIEDAKSVQNIDHKDVNMWKSINDEWGVEILSIVISDIVLPEELKKIRNELLQARKNAEKAIEEKKAKITLAEADKNVLELLGEGLAKQVADLKKLGLNEKEAVQYLAERMKWEKVGDKTVIIDNGAGVSGLGAQFGAGINATKK